MICTRAKAATTSPHSHHGRMQTMFGICVRGSASSFPRQIPPALTTPPPPLPPSLAVHSHYVASHASCTPDQWPRWRKGAGTVMHERAMNAQLDGGWISDTCSRPTRNQPRAKAAHQEHNNTHTFARTHLDTGAIVVGGHLDRIGLAQIRPHGEWANQSIARIPDNQLCVPTSALCARTLHSFSKL
jgi:hypothetical protein